MSLSRSVLRSCHHDADQPMHCPLSGCAAQCVACALRARALRARTCEQTNSSTEVEHVPITPCSQPEHGAVVMSQSPSGLSPVQLHTNLFKPQTCKRDSGQHVQQARSVTQPLHARMHPIWARTQTLRPKMRNDNVTCPGGESRLTSAACSHTGICIYISSINALLRDHTATERRRERRRD
jgi:hypothetical protein